MKRIIAAIFISMIAFGNADAYQMTKKDSDIVRTIIDMVEKRGIQNLQKHMDIITGYKDSHKSNERIQLVLANVIRELEKRSPNPASSSMTEMQKSVALQLTTLCENSDKRLQYNYAEDIGDGRGITFGIIGFTTGTYDGNILLKHYSELNPSNDLKKYIPALDRIDDGGHDENGLNANTDGLDGFIRDVNANSDPLFKKAQIDLMNSMYWDPAARISDENGAKNALTRAFIYDMVVNHGEYGAKGIISKATVSMGGNMKSGIDEKKWLEKTMDFRYEFLMREYPDGIGRIEAFRELSAKGNTDLLPGFEFSVYGDTFVVDGDVY